MSEIIILEDYIGIESDEASDGIKLHLKQLTKKDQTKNITLVFTSKDHINKMIRVIESFLEEYPSLEELSPEVNKNE